MSGKLGRFGGVLPAMLGVISLAMLVFADLQAAAQTAKDDSVKNRPRPEFDAIGMELDEVLAVVGLVDARTVERKNSPLASFNVFPRLGFGAQYDSNLFRVDENPAHDQIAILTPAVSIESDWVNHSLNLSATGKVTRHQRTDSEDSESYRLGARGRIDVSIATQINGLFEFAREQEERSSTDDPGQAFPPTLFSSRVAEIGFLYNPDVVSLSANLETTWFDYDDAGTSDNDVRDRVETELTTRLAYEYVPGTSLFVEPVFNWQRYNQLFDAFGFLQNSQGFEILVGSTWDATGVLFAEFGVGYLRQEYDDPAYPTVSGPSVSAKLVWNPRDWLTMRASIDRAIVESQIVDVSGSLNTDFALGIDFDAAANLIVSLDTSFSKARFNGNGQRDRTVSGTFAVNYFVNRNISLLFALNRTRTSSTDPNAKFGDTTATLTISNKL